MVAAIVGTAVAVSSVAGAAISSGAAGDAGDAQAAAADRSAQLQHAQFEESRADLAPWRTAGGSALQKIADLYGLGNIGLNGGSTAPLSSDELASRQKASLTDFQTSPDYTFRFDQGLKALDRSSAARGKLFSGDQLQGAQEFGQGLASTEYGNYVNRLSSVAGVGQGATTATAQLGAASAANEGQAIENAGTARASGYVGAANAWGQGLSGVAQGAGMYLGATQTPWWAKTTGVN